LTYTFRGGLHIAEHKDTRNSPIEKMTPPAEIRIPLSRHIGDHCKSVVKVGDRVLRGQVIGEACGELGCPIHSSVSGIVKSIDRLAGEEAECVVIENDGEYELSPDIKPCEKKLTETTTQEIVEVIRNAGISGMGGASFPAWTKIQSAVGKAERLIVNCAESEPYVTANHRLMLERPVEIINGTKIILKALGLRSADIAVEDNKLDAVEKLAEKIGESKMIRIRVMRAKYPQGDERQLVYALTGKEVPKGKLPIDVGCIVFNAETCAAIYRAFAYGMPLIERIVTVSGDCVATPKNVLAPIGATYKSLIDYCGGLKKEPRKIIDGGPMMGTAQKDVNAPITKNTFSVLVLSEDTCASDDENYSCIRCGRCVSVCPMRLLPNYIVKFAEKGRYEDAEKYDTERCVECGLCAYSCPGRVPLMRFIREAKSAIFQRRSENRENSAEDVDVTL